MKEKPKMPLVLAKQQAEIEIKRAVNAACAAYGVPFFELDDILFRIEAEVRAGAERERQEAQRAYNKAIQEMKEESDEDGSGTDSEINA